MLDRIWLIPVGFIIGTYGTLIGAGGGFVLVPMLILLYPQESPEVITSISLAVVFFNALSGSLAYMRLKRVDYRSGLLFAAATIPGAILGALTTSFIPRPLFDIFLGLMLIAASIFLILHTHKEGGEGKGHTGRRSCSKSCRSRRHNPYLLLFSHRRNRTEPRCRVCFEFIGDWGWNHPRPCSRSPFKLSSPRCNGNFPFYPGDHGLDRDRGSYCDGCLSPRH